MQGGNVPLYQDEKFALLFAEYFAKVLAVYILWVGVQVPSTAVRIIRIESRDSILFSLRKGWGKP